MEKIKLQISKKLKKFLYEEGIELYIAANDNTASAACPSVTLESIHNDILPGTVLLSEIKVKLGILGAPWQCEAIIAGIYEALQPHHITQAELNILLMSLQVEPACCTMPRCVKKCATMSYIVEPVYAATAEPAHANANSRKAEFC